MSDAEPEAEEVQEDIEPAEPGEAESVPGVPDRLTKMLPPQMRQMMSVLNEDNGIAKLLLRPAFVADEDGNPQVSQAAVVADMVNILRLDTKAMGEAAGVDIEVKRMTPQSAAMMLQELVKVESMDLIEQFNHIEEQRERILAALTDEATVEDHRETKEHVSYVHQAEVAVEEDDDAA